MTTGMDTDRRRYRVCTGGSGAGIPTASEQPVTSRVAQGRAGNGLIELHYQGMKLFMIDMGRVMFRPIPVTSYRMPPISAVMLRIEASIPRI
jgi:hypothetical protein